MKKISFILSFTIALLLSTFTILANPSSPDGIDQFIEFANDFLERRTQSLIEPIHEMIPLSIESNQELAIFSDNIKIVQEPDGIFSDEERITSDLNELRMALLSWGEAYTHFDKEVTLVSYDINNDQTTIVVRELTRLYYDRIHGDEPDYTAWSVERKFVFIMKEQGWSLLYQELLNSNEFSIPPLNEPLRSEISIDEMLRSLSTITPFSYNEQDSLLRKSDHELRERNGNHEAWLLTLENHGVVPLSGTFNRQAAANYALLWWNRRNPAFRDFDGRGGNCTNFISQAMRAGGWTDVTGFYRDASFWWYHFANQTWSWVGVNHWHDFASIHSGRTIMLSNPRNLFVGEVLQVDFDGGTNKGHTMIVTRRTDRDIYLTFNSNDTLNASFSSLVARFPNASWFSHLVFTHF